MADRVAIVTGASSGIGEATAKELAGGGTRWCSPLAAGGSAYTASKFGVNGFCRSLRKELSDEDVRVSIVMPGPVVTGMNDWAEWEGRPLVPGDVAEPIVFAISRPDHVELPEITVDTTDKLA